MSAAVTAATRCWWPHADTRQRRRDRRQSAHQHATVAGRSRLLPGGHQGLGQTLAVAFAKSDVMPSSESPGPSTREGWCRRAKLTGAELGGHQPGPQARHPWKTCCCGTSSSNHGYPGWPCRASSVCPTGPIAPTGCGPRPAAQPQARLRPAGQWLPLEGEHRGHADPGHRPDQALASRVVQNTSSPRPLRSSALTTHLEFMQTVAQFFGGSATGDASVSDLLSGHDRRR